VDLDHPIKMLLHFQKSTEKYRSLYLPHQKSYNTSPVNSYPVVFEFEACVLFLGRPECTEIQA